MDTIEHTELGNELRIGTLEGNPYVRIDESGVIHLRLQRISENNLPDVMDLEMSAGEIIAMAGDYFTQKDWTMSLNLPHCERFNSAANLGRFLIRKPIEAGEETALMTAYNNLASPQVSRKQIDKIYSINNATYIPFFSSLNSYAQQLMLYLRVKDYGEMLIRNQTHFTPWAIRVYILGHHIALRYARLSYELKQLAANSNYQSTNPELHAIKDHFANMNLSLSAEKLIDLAHRYHAQAWSVELFTFHYYSDHFATGHMSMVGDLRVKLQERFGTWGSILASNLHDEINRIGAYTVRPYDPTPNKREEATRARGDGAFDSCLNQENRKQCLAGMTNSLNDLNLVLYGEDLPQPQKFGGLEHLPDIDYNSRQHQPLLVLSKGKIFHRTNLRQTQIISPSEYETLRSNPQEHGYSEITSTWDAFILVIKLRLFPYIYSSTVTPLTKEREEAILLDEKQRKPQRKPIARPQFTPQSEPEATVFNWKGTMDAKSEQHAAMAGLKNVGVLKLKPTAQATAETVAEELRATMV